jgi:hypothetical protein
MKGPNIQSGMNGRAMQIESLNMGVVELTMGDVIT